MAGVFQTVTFMALVFTAVVVFAEDYDVGDESEWMRPTTPDFYTTWATGKTFRVGDELEFDFAAGRHDVAVVTKDAYENCDKMKPISLMTIPPVKIRLNTTGPQYFICTIGDHCRSGQKLAITVVAPGAAPGSGATPGAGGGAATPAPGSSPGVGGTTPPTAGGTTTPSGSSGTTTPAGNAASSLGGATFLVAFVSAIVALF